MQNILFHLIFIMVLFPRFNIRKSIDHSFKLSIGICNQVVSEIRFKLTSSCLFFLAEVHASSIEINELEWPKCNDKTCVCSAGYFRSVKSHPSCGALIIFDLLLYNTWNWFSITTHIRTVIHFVIYSWLFELNLFAIHAYNWRLL